MSNGASPLATGPAPLRAEPAAQSQAEPLVPCAELLARLRRLADPFSGIKRGIIDRVERGKGSPDPDSKMIPISIGELREAHAAIIAAIRELEAK